MSRNPNLIWTKSSEVLADIKATELLPEIKALFDTGCVNCYISGDYKSIVKSITYDKTMKEEYSIPNIHEQYDDLETFLIKP